VAKPEKQLICSDLIRLELILLRVHHILKITIIAFNPGMEFTDQRRDWLFSFAVILITYLAL